MFAPPWSLPNIPGAPQNPSEWESAALDLAEGWFGDPANPYIGWPRIIPVFQAPPEPDPIAVIPQLPVERPWEYVYPEPPPIVRSVLPGPVAERPAPVPRTTVVVAGVPTEVEQHPEGDFPAGSIFAPGRTWGGVSEWEDHGLDSPDPQEDDVSIWGDLFSAGVDVLQGQYQMPGYATTMGFQGPVATTRPSGAAALPPSAAPVVSTASGDGCGNRRYVTLDRQTGKITCKRRRRRRLLTNRDLADLASLKTITGGGAALNAAVIRAVR